MVAGEIVLGCRWWKRKGPRTVSWALYHLEGRELRTGQESKLPQTALGAEAVGSLVGWSLWVFPPGVLGE